MTELEKMINDMIDARLEKLLGMKDIAKENITTSKDFIEDLDMFDDEQAIIPTFSMNIKGEYLKSNIELSCEDYEKEMIRTIHRCRDVMRNKMFLCQKKNRPQEDYIKCACVFDAFKYFGSDYKGKIKMTKELLLTRHHWLEILKKDKTFNKYFKINKSRTRVTVNNKYKNLDKLNAILLQDLNIKNHEVI